MAFFLSQLPFVVTFGQKARMRYTHHRFNNRLSTKGDPNATLKNGPISDGSEDKYLS